MNDKLSKLTNLKVLSDGWVAQCPICAMQGHDLNGRNHLKIFRTGAFNCAKYGKDKAHNRAIRKFLLGDSVGNILNDIVYIDPEPKLESEKVYPSSILDKLVKDDSYWYGRNISTNVLAPLGGGLAPNEKKNKLSGRYIFPIYNSSNQIVGFSGRLIYDNSLAPKWKHLFKSSKVCWPLHVTRKHIQNKKSVVLLESIGDFLTLAENGIWNTLVLFGLNMNSKVLSAMIGLSVENIFISTNNDNRGQGLRAAEKIRTSLSSYFAYENIHIVLPTKSNDWGEASAEEIENFKQILNKC